MHQIATMLDNMANMAIVLTALRHSYFTNRNIKTELVFLSLQYKRRSRKLVDNLKIMKII